MCGIAGISIRDGVDIDVELVVLSLLAGLAERGEDAAGYASISPTGKIDIKRRTGPVLPFLSSVSLDQATKKSIVHLRDYTKGCPSMDLNNHPIRHGRIVGVHNGRVQNDEQLFRDLKADRAQPGMTVDSEAIFMALDKLPSTEEALSMIVGSYACAWIDENDLDLITVARGDGRPLVIGHGDGFCIFASTIKALSFMSLMTGLEVEAERVGPGTLMGLRDGQVEWTRGFSVTPFIEEELIEYDYSIPNATKARAWVAAESKNRKKSPIEEVA